jgi:ribosomal protein L44E
MHNQKPIVHNKMKYPQTQNLHCPQCADKENTNVVERGVKNITKTSRRCHRAGGGAEGPKAGGSLSKMAQNIS